LQNSTDNFVSGEQKELKRSETILIVLFACLGNMAALIPRTYTAGFYVDFLTEQSLDTTIG
jgi:hypothetical protein